MGFEQDNQRRCELINKKYSTGLTAKEEIELTNKTKIVEDYIQKHHPRDEGPLLAFEQFVRQLKEEARRRSSTGRAADL